MRHFVGRVDIKSGNVKPLFEVESEEIAWDGSKKNNQEQDKINKSNSELKDKKNSINFNIPKFDKEIHVSLKKYIKLKNDLKTQLNEDDRKLFHEPYLIDVIPRGTKLVYLAVHEVTD